MNLVERRDVTQATIDHFLPKPFAWDKAATCLHLIRRHVRAMGKPVPTMPRFRSALSARAAMQARGWSSLAEVMDAVLPRILPSEAIIGDVVELQSEDAMFGALCVAVGNGRVTGYFEGHDGLTVLQPVAPIIAAWRT